MLTRRDFIVGLSWAGFQNDTLKRVNSLVRWGVGEDEAFWADLRKSFRLDESLVQFNHAGLSPSPQTVEDAMALQYQRANQNPSLAVYRQQPQELDEVRSRLASLIGCKASQVVLTPNATYGLHTGILGWDCPPGVLAMSSHEYPRATAAIDQRVRREGFSKTILPVSSKGENLRSLPALVPEGTRVGVFSQVTYVNGTVLPITELCKRISEVGGKSVVDGAQAIGIHKVDFEAIGCDVYTACLHKWVMAPVGTGVMALNLEAISELWPLHPGEDSDRESALRFEHWGTRSLAPFLAIREALDFHELIGLEAKLRRIRTLRDHLLDGLERVPRLQIFSVRDRSQHDLLLTVGVSGMSGYDLASQLMAKRIHVTPVARGGLSGVRLSPSIFSSLLECDIVVSAIRDLAM